MICSAQRIESAMALTVAGTRAPLSYCAGFLAARIAAAISGTRLRQPSIFAVCSLYLAIAKEKSSGSPLFAVSDTLEETS
jgi:hypothetical protein